MSTVQMRRFGIHLVLLETRTGMLGCGVGSVAKRDEHEAECAKARAAKLQLEMSMEVDCGICYERVRQPAHSTLHTHASTSLAS